MKFDIKCFFGLHHYKLIETKELKILIVLL